MTPQQTVEEYEAKGYTLILERSFVNGNKGWLRLEKVISDAELLYKLIPVNKQEYEEITSVVAKR